MDQDLDFSTLAIAHKLLSHEQVEVVQGILDREAKAGRPARPIQEVFLEQGMLKREEIWAITKAQERMMKDAKNIGRRIGGYELIEKVGEGGLGVVYKARQLSMGRVVALKCLHEKWVNDDEFRKRFLVEARLVGRLSHQNLIQVFDVGRYRNTLYYSMEFIDGETVEAKLDRDGPMELDEAVDIIFQIGRALAYLRTKKIVHRDVKPGNIMMTSNNVAKLGDFGFVKSSLDSVLSPDGEVLGTPDYISPEAAMGDQDIDFRSDLYSLGASLYHMLCGSPPFGGTGSAVMEAHIRDQPPSLRTHIPNMEPRCCQIVERMMAKRREDRYTSYDEMFEELEKLRIEIKPSASSKVSKNRSRDRVDEVLIREEKLKQRLQLLTYLLLAQGGLLLIALLVLIWLALFR